MNEVEDAVAAGAEDGTPELAIAQPTTRTYAWLESMLRDREGSHRSHRGDIEAPVAQALDDVRRPMPRAPKRSPARFRTRPQCAVSQQGEALILER